MRTLTTRRRDVDVVDEAEIDDVEAELRIDHEPHGVLDLIDQIGGGRDAHDAPVPPVPIRTSTL